MFVRVKGRIASLLEVGTGFHQELTGRENVYLNGSILGMTRIEIRKKFDEIVEFSGVGNYIDTPVKRYSSGMYVRLAFAVAALVRKIKIDSLGWSVSFKRVYGKSEIPTIVADCVCNYIVSFFRMEC